MSTLDEVRERDKRTTIYDAGTPDERVGGEAKNAGPRAAIDRRFLLSEVDRLKSELSALKQALKLARPAIEAGACWTDERGRFDVDLADSIDKKLCTVAVEALKDITAYVEGLRGSAKKHASHAQQLRGLLSLSEP